jgi:hypothetical protein
VAARAGSCARFTAFQGCGPAKRERRVGAFQALGARHVRGHGGGRGRGGADGEAVFEVGRAVERGKAAVVAVVAGREQHLLAIEWGGGVEIFEKSTKKTSTHFNALCFKESQNRDRQGHRSHKSLKGEPCVE